MNKRDSGTVSYQIDHSCPYCGKQNRFASGRNGGAAPTSGDVLLCNVCKKAGVMGRDGRVRLPTSKEMHEFASELGEEMLALLPELKRRGEHDLRVEKAKGEN